MLFLSKIPKAIRKEQGMEAGCPETRLLLHIPVGISSSWGILWMQI
jgi:hypothetical protein